jgi:hypothetical protein
MSTEIDISMFDTDHLKLTLFTMLINNSTSKTNFITSDVDLTRYDYTLKCIKKGYIDRFNGRVFKGDISGKTFDAGLYNRDNGNGAAQRIVKYIREQLQI